MKRYILSVLFIILTCSIGTFADVGEEDPKVKGKVVDGETGEPLEYATVSLLNAADSSLVDGIVTTADGTFVLDATLGNYILRIQFISYQDKFISDISFNRSRQVVNIGEVVLSSDTELLDEVVVIAERGQMQLELDKRVFNVGENVNNIGSNASEIMDNLPSVSVDVDGNVSLRGSNNVRILVNGKPSGLVGISSTDGLRQLQGDLIERIEVITNPSARYDAEGSAGIINIILKKDREKGFHGAFTANAGFPENFGLSGNINYRAGRFNLFGSYGINYRENPGGGYTDRFSFGRDTLFTYIDNDRVRSGLSHNFRLGADFYLNANNIITLSGLTRVSDEKNISDITYFDRDINQMLISNTFRQDFEVEDDNNVEFQVGYRKIFPGSEGHELTAEVQYRDNFETEDSSIDSANLLTESDRMQYQRSLNKEGDKNILLQADYVYPFDDGKKFETGYRGTLREISSDYLVEQIDDQDNWQPLENFSNQFIYNEDVHAAYAIYENKMDRWGYQLGVRLEQTYITTYQRETNATNKKDYLNAFPSAFVSYKVDQEKSLQASYSRRLSRPRFWYLNPFSSFSDPRNIRTGNTDLDPEYTDSYELGLLTNLENSSIYLGGYYRFITGVIDRISTSEDGLRTVSTPRNIGTENAYGIEANFTMDLVKWLNINGNANFYRAITEGRYQDLILSRDTYTSRFRLNNIVKVGKMNIQLSGNYRAPETSTQGIRKSMYSVDLGANMDVLNGDGTLNLSARDLFNTRKYRGSTETDNFIEDREFQWRSRQIRLSFTYRLNQKKQRDRGGDRGDYGGGEEF